MENEVENENEVEVENKVEVENEFEVKLNQTKLNWAVTQLKLKLVLSKIPEITHCFASKAFKLVFNLLSQKV